MSGSNSKKTSDKKLSREERLAKSLRDNLRRRKQAARKKPDPNLNDKDASRPKT